MEPGNIEACFKYVGKGAADTKRARAVNDNLCIRLPPGTTVEFIHIIDQYKHLGSVINVDSNLVPDARHRSSLALNAYDPIACKVFGCKCVPANLKRSSYKSLVESRLLYGAELW